MALLCTGRTTSLGSVVRNENNKCSPSSGDAFVPRVPVHGRQTPAKANGVRSGSSANQCGIWQVMGNSHYLHYGQIQ